MAKQLTPKRWATLKVKFNEWCIANAKVSVKGAYKSLQASSKKGLNIPSLSGYEKKAKLDGWAKDAENLLHRHQAPELKEEVEELREEAATLIGYINPKASGAKQAGPTINATDQIREMVSDSVRKAKEGFTSCQDLFVDVAYIAAKQASRIREVMKDPNKSMSMEEANALKSLVSAAKESRGLFGQVANITRDDLKVIQTLDMTSKIQENLEKEKAKHEGKETGSERDQKALYGKLTKYAEKKGVKLG